MDKEQDKKAYAHAEKAYMHGTMFPYIKVGMQKVNLTPTVNIVNGEKVATPNAPVYIYDTSGPFSDPDIEIDLKKGLPRMRESWITGRGDVEQLPSITSEYGKMRRDDKSLNHLRFEHIALPYRAKAGKAITQPCVSPRKRAAAPPICAPLSQESISAVCVSSNGTPRKTSLLIHKTIPISTD